MGTCDPRDRSQEGSPTGSERSGPLRVDGRQVGVASGLPTNRGVVRFRGGGVVVGKRVSKIIGNY